MGGWIGSQRTGTTDLYDTNASKWELAKWQLPEPRAGFAFSYNAGNHTCMIYGGTTDGTNVPRTYSQLGNPNLLPISIPAARHEKFSFV
jgi:hypothetical protein